MKLRNRMVMFLDVQMNGGKELDQNPCRLCLMGQDMMCIERKFCRWTTDREIYTKDSVEEQR